MRKFVLFLFLLSAVLFFLDKKGWLVSVRGVAQVPVVAFEKKVYSLKQSVDLLLKPIASCRFQESELLRLQLEVQKLAVDQNKLFSYLEENEKMRKLLGAPLSPKWKFLPARIAGISGFMKIDKGLKDGVKPGMTVISENILVGKVTSVGNNDSLVKLPITTGTKISVLVKNLSAGERPAESSIKAKGLLVGQYGGGLVLDEVLQEEDIQKGDFVVSSGDEDWAPDLLIGEIENVLPKSAELFRKAKVTPLVDYFRLTTVFVIIER